MHMMELIDVIYIDRKFAKDVLTSWDVKRLPRQGRQIVRVGMRGKPCRVIGHDAHGYYYGVERMV